MTVNDFIFPENFTSLTNPRISVMFGSGPLIVTAVIRFRDDVSHNMHGYKTITNVNYRVPELNLLHISLT